MVRLYYRLTDDFRLSNISYQLPFEAPWQVPQLTSNERSQLSQILNQKFFYIGKGAQCYAFASEDDQYVLKFFKFKHLKPDLFIDLLPSIPPFKSFKQNCIERKKRKLIGVFEGYDLAYRENRHGSKLFYLHLVPTQTVHQKATVVDKLGLEKQINLDDVVFLVQSKGETLRTRLQRFLNEGQLQNAQEAISDLGDVYFRIQKGDLRPRSWRHA